MFLFALLTNNMRNDLKTVRETFNITDGNPLPMECIGISETEGVPNVTFVSNLFIVPSVNYGTAHNLLGRKQFNAIAI